MNRTRVLIAGAAGRDFHNFNLVYRGREEFQIVGFTATQIPNIDGRVYPPELAGELRRIDAAVDVRDLRCRECDNVVLGATPIDDVEVVEVAAGRAGDQHPRASHE